MQRRFTDADELLDHLLDRHDAGVARPIAYPDYEGFATVTATDVFLKALRRAEESPMPDPAELEEGVYASPEDLETPHHK